MRNRGPLFAWGGLSTDAYSIVGLIDFAFQYANFLEFGDLILTLFFKLWVFSFAGYHDLVPHSLHVMVSATPP
jgi:hypothetical protein